MPVIFHAILCLRGFSSLTPKIHDTQSENSLLLDLSRGWVDKSVDFGSLGPRFESGSRQIFFFFILSVNFVFFQLSDLLQKWQTPFWNWHCISVFHSFSKSQKFEKKMEKVSSRRDLNPDLPIQSQLCLPLDQGFMKIAWKYQKFLTRFFKI